MSKGIQRGAKSVNFPRHWIFLVRYSAFSLALASLISPAALRAQDPIVDLKNVLLTRPKIDPLASDEKQQQERKRFHAERERQLGGIIDTKFTTFGDLREALSLKEWGDVARTERDDPDVIATDARMRFRVAQRFQAGVRVLVERGDNDSRAAVANLIVELGLNIRTALDPTMQLPSDELDRQRRAGFARNLTEEITRLTAVDNELVRLHALRALGGINADPSRAAPLLASRLASGNSVVVRRISADGLLRLVATAAFLKEQSFKSPPVWANDLDVIAAGVEVVRHAVVGLADADAEVRRSCAEAIRTSAEVLAVHFQRPPDEARSVAARSHSPAEIAALKALLKAFEAAGPRVAATLSDPAVEVRLALVRTLEQLCDARCRLAEEAFAVDGAAERVSLAPPHASDPLANFAKGDWPSAARLLADPDARVRRGAVNFLEYFGEARPTVVPELAKSLADSDRFVRLGSARALGNFTKAYQPRDAAPVVPALAALLFDNDIAIRLAAAVTLESLGPCAESAVPDLVRAIHFGDIENRVAALRVVESIGPDRSKLAIPSVTAALTHPDPRVRRTAAEALGRYGPAARNQATTDALRRALSDADQAVRIRASEAVRLILAPGMPSAR